MDVPERSLFLGNETPKREGPRVDIGWAMDGSCDWAIVIIWRLIGEEVWMTEPYPYP